MYSNIINIGGKQYKTFFKAFTNKHWNNNKNGADVHNICKHSLKKKERKRKNPDTFIFAIESQTSVD